MSLQQYFPEAAADEALLKRLEHLSSAFASSAVDFFAKWEAFSIRNHDPKITDPESFDAFQESLVQKARTNSAKRPRLITKPARPRAAGAGFLGLKTESKRLGAHRYEVKGHASNADVTSPSAPCRFALNTDLAEFERQRPFFDMSRDISECLNAQIEDMATMAAERLGWSRSVFSSPHSTSQSTVTVIGRICREIVPGKLFDEAKEDWGKVERLGPKAMQIETSRKVGCALRTQLDLRLVSDSDLCRIFEGQVVILRGKNPEGKMFVVENFVDLPMLSVAQVPPTKLDENSSPSVSRICIFNGLASNNDGLTLETVLGWVAAACEQGISYEIPSAVVLMGPLISTERVANLYQAKKELVNLLRQFRLETNGKVPVLLIPRAQDAITSDPLFPQPGYDSSQLELEQPIIALSNPCTFSISELAITISTAPTLDDMPVEGLDTKFRHVLRQRQIYPVYPPAVTTNVSVPALRLAKLEVAPNLLILPTTSDSRSQMLTVDGVQCLSIANDPVVMVTVNQSDANQSLDQRLVFSVLQIQKAT